MLGANVGVTKGLGGLGITNDGTKTTLLGITGDYLRIGDAVATSHSLNSEDDLLVTGNFEAKDESFFDANIWGTTVFASSYFSGNAASVEFYPSTGANDGHMHFNGWDTGVGWVEVMRLVGAADPYIGLGIDGAVLKATNAGLLGFFAATPVAKQAHIANPTDLATCITAVTAINALLETFGLKATT